ncbi:MAG TPA: hypothetical protein PLQ54_20170, partial [Armatimonadota bacterium]|nr:hypothetical protein [Armatimonadota bacterium]
MLVDIGDETCVGALAAGPGPALEAEREATVEQMEAASEILRLRLAGGYLKHRALPAAATNRAGA